MPTTAKGSGGAGAMSVQVTYNKAQFARMEKKLAEQKIWTQPLGQLMHDAAEFARAEAASNAKDLGAIPSAIVAEVHGLDARVKVSRPGARIMEVGRKPLIAGGKFPPPDAFARYGPQIQFALASVVAKRGIKGRFFMRKAKTKLNRSEFGRLIKLAKKAIRDGWNVA